MDNTIKLKLGDCLEILKNFPNNFIDSCVSDPPYGISFMGKKWDYDVPKIEIWKEVLRVLKPGAHILIACGTRTQHRMAVNLEDAGFEIRDIVAWVYGSGFPKSLNIEKQIEDKELSNQYKGWGTALKPAMELWTLARKPLEEKTVAENILKYGTGGINIEGCRVGIERITLIGGGGGKGTGWGLKHEINIERQGRFPANFIHDGSEEVVEEFPDSNGSGKTRILKRSIKPNQKGWGMNKNNSDEVILNDSGKGSASRFFYCAKASKKERNLGSNNNHPTVKPVSLMRYLCRLITPSQGIIIDPFMGSGSTGIGAKLEGFRFIGIEMNEEYFKIAEARISAWEEYNKE